MKTLGYKPRVLEKAKFEYSPVGVPLNKALKKDGVKSIAKSKSDFNYDSNHTFYIFYKGYDEFEEMSLDSKYNRMKELINLLLASKLLKQKKTETRLKKERIIENVDKLLSNVDNKKSITMPVKLIIALMIS